MSKSLFLFLLSIISFTNLQSQGVKGNITDEEGKPLPYASIYIKEKSSGTTSNANGYYEFKIEPGVYDLSFQFMGYTTQTKKVKVGNNLVNLDVQLQPQSFTVDEVTITEDAEDPAYTIMRKAIAKSKYHLLQCDKYTATVYMKGTGQVKKIPGLFRKALEEEGVDTSRAFTSESVSEISFERPNIFKENVISVRASGKDDPSANPSGYLNASFYQPEVVSAISPLSPSAFRYYKFEYLGSFMDRNFEINKIKVIPRSRGENVYEGEIYIRETYWNIHSLKLSCRIPLYDVKIEQFFAPIVDDIWMPVTQKYIFSVGLFGFNAQYDYYASTSRYQITKNGDLNAIVKLIDEEIEKAPEELESIKEGEVEEGLNDVFDKEKEVSNEQFFDLMEDYEEEEMEKTENEDILYDYTFKMDSLAKTRDSTYWADIRTVPLTEKEKRSYVIDDSVYVVNKEERKNDSLRLANGDRFGFGDMFFGGYYKLGKRLRFDFPGFLPNLRYNTVEGFNLDFTGTLQWRGDTSLHLKIKPFVRYGFASHRVYPKLRTEFRLGKRDQRHYFAVEGGKYVSQFKPNSIDPLVNSLYTLLLERNYMRLYEKDYVKAGWAKRMGFKYEFQAGVEWANRRQLFNNTNYSLINFRDQEFESNQPINLENGFVPFNNSKALITRFEIKAKPWLKFRKYNGRIRPIGKSSAKLRFAYNAGWSGILGSSTDFQQVEIGFEHTLKLGAKAKIDLDLEAGSFLRNEQLLFADYKHFDGMLTEFAPLSLTGNYRLLDYYNFSTSNSYFSALTYIRFRKLFVTQIPAVRLLGIKENFFVNYLKTDFSPNYTEIGYTIDGLFNLFRLELVHSFNDLDAGNFGFRIGIATLLGDN